MDADFYFDLITACWLGFTGACIGSFLNVVAYRVPQGMTIVWKPSHCPNCSHAIRARDNIPVLGWLLLGGRCRDCGQPISPRYALVELAMGAAFFVLAYGELFSGGANLPGGPLTEFTGAMNIVWYPDWPMIAIYLYHCLLLSLLAVVVLWDMDKNPIPRGFTWFAAAAIVTSALALPGLYPDRQWFVGQPRLSGIVDALTGGAILSVLGFVVWGLVRTVLSVRSTGEAARDALRYTYTLSLAGFIAGGFLGRYAALALLLLWAIGMVATRIGNRLVSDARISLLPSLWLATLIFILFWRPLIEVLPIR